MTLDSNRTRTCLVGLVMAILTITSIECLVELSGSNQLASDTNKLSAPNLDPIAAAGSLQPQQQLVVDPDEPAMLSESRNLTVFANETVHLPCLVRKTLNTIVIWNQCEDPACIHLRNPLTINKGNFIEDLRFRVLSESPTDGGAPITSDVEHHHNHHDDLTTVKRDSVAAARNMAVIKPGSTAAAATTNVDDQTTGVSAWTLEIRRFSKLDEACYQCQLNSFRVQTIHYCLKLQTRVMARPRKQTVRVNSPIRLRCSTDENVRLSNVKWLHNGHRLNDEANAAGGAASEFTIDKRALHDHISTTLHIKHARLADAGTYTCKFGQLSEKIHVDVLSAGDERKSSEIRSRDHQEDESSSDQVVPSITESISDAMFSSATPTGVRSINNMKSSALLFFFLPFSVVVFSFNRY